MLENVLIVLAVLICCYCVTLIIDNSANLITRLLSSGLFIKPAAETEDEDEYAVVPDEYCVYDIESFKERIERLKADVAAETNDDGIYDVVVTPSPTKMTGVEIPAE